MSSFDFLVRMYTIHSMSGPTIEERVLFRSKMDRLMHTQPLRYTKLFKQSYETAHANSKDIPLSQLWFDQTTYRALKDILALGFICAGGYAWRQLLRRGPANDADLWIVDTSEHEWSVKQTRATEMVWRAIDMIIRAHGPCKVAHADHHITVETEWHGGSSSIKYQFVLRIYRSLGELLNSFDFPIAQTAWDGKQYYATAAAQFCLDREVCLVDPTRMHPGSYGRVCKYAQSVRVVLVGMKPVDGKQGKLVIKSQYSRVVFDLLHERIYGSNDISAEYRQSSGMTYVPNQTEQAYLNQRYIEFNRKGFMATIVNIKPGDNVRECVLGAPLLVEPLLPENQTVYSRPPQKQTYYGSNFAGWYESMLQEGMDQWEIAEKLTGEHVYADDAELRKKLHWQRVQFPLAVDDAITSHKMWRGVRYGNLAMERCLRLCRLRYPFATLPRDVFLIILQKTLIADNGF
jgi:hypothetical protein